MYLTISLGIFINLKTHKKELKQVSRLNVVLLNKIINKIYERYLSYETDYTFESGHGNINIKKGQYKNTERSINKAI